MTDEDTSLSLEIGEALLETETAEKQWVAECMTRIAVDWRRKNGARGYPTHPPYRDVAALWASWGLVSDSGEIDRNLRRFFCHLYPEAEKTARAFGELGLQAHLSQLIAVLTRGVDWPFFDCEAAEKNYSWFCQKENLDPMTLPLFCRSTPADPGTEAENVGIVVGIAAFLLSQEAEIETTKIVETLAAAGVVRGTSFEKLDLTEIGRRTLHDIRAVVAIDMNSCVRKIGALIVGREKEAWASMAIAAMKTVAQSTDEQEKNFVAIAAKLREASGYRWNQPFYSKKAVSAREQHVLPPGGAVVQLTTLDFAPFLSGDSDPTAVAVDLAEHVTREIVDSRVIPSGEEEISTLAEIIEEMHVAAMDMVGPTFRMIVTAEQVAVLEAFGIVSS